MASGNIICGALEKIISDTTLTNNTAKTFTPSKRFTFFKDLILALNVNGVTMPIEFNVPLLLLKGGARFQVYANSTILGYCQIQNFGGGSMTVTVSLSGTIANLNLEVYGAN